LKGLGSYRLNRKGTGGKNKLDKKSHEDFQGLVLLLAALEFGFADSQLEKLQEDTALWNEIDQEVLEPAVNCAISFLSERCHIEADKVVAKQWLSRRHVNTFELGRNFGEVMFSRLSFFNHSCQPNVSHAKVDDCDYLFAKQDIPKGEELCITYINEDAPVQERRGRLQESFRFKCQCIRCLAEDLPSKKKIQKMSRRLKTNRCSQAIACAKVKARANASVQV